MRLSLTFMTGRAEPHLDWVLDSLAGQVSATDEIELIVIDALDRGALALPPVIGERELAILARPELERMTTKVSAPKPNVWQGAHRVTSVDWWATANARNTAIVLASHDYLAFLDDRCRLGPRWLESVRAAERARSSVIVGSYEKYEHAPIGDPACKLTHDHRRTSNPGGRANCGGGWLYGCTFALPLAWALECNGLEEGCDGLTGEDYIFGLMLANNGHRIDFVPELFVSQDRTPGNASCKGTYRCMDKGQSPRDKSHAALERFGKATRTQFTPNLTELRLELVRGGVWPIPDPAGDHRDWYDGQPIKEM